MILKENFKNNLSFKYFDLIIFRKFSTTNLQKIFLKFMMRRRLRIMWFLYVYTNVIFKSKRNKNNRLVAPCGQYSYFNLYPTKVGFFRPDKYYWTKKGILLSAICIKKEISNWSILFKIFSNFWINKNILKI